MVGFVTIERLVTELDAKGDFKHYHFKELGDIYIDYTHTFTTEILEDALPEETVKKRKRRKPNIDEKKALEEVLLQRFDESQIIEKDSPFRILQVKAKRSDMIGLIREERDKALWKKLEEQLDEKQQKETEKIWKRYKNKLQALQRLKGTTKDEGFKDLLECIIKRYKEDYKKAGFAISNKIVTGHYTEMVRWGAHHPWSYHEIKTDTLVELLQERNKIEQKLREIRTEAEKTLDDNVKRTITDMNKFFDRFYGTKRFKDIKKRKFAEKLGPDLVAERTEVQKDIESLREKLPGLGRIEREEDELKVILDSDEHFAFKRYINSEDLMDMTWCFIDIEKPRFNTPKEEVSWVAIKYFTPDGQFKKEIHTSKKVGEEFKRQFAEEDCTIIDHYENEDWLMAGIEKSINSMNPEVLCAYNTSYDFIELRETDHGLTLGKRKARPRKEVTTRFFERIDVKDKIIIDPLPWAKIAKKFLPNRKIAMIAQELGLDFKKSIDYKMMAELEDIIDGMSIEEASKNTQEKIREHAGEIEDISNLKEACAQIIAKYVGADVDILPELIFHPEMQRYFKHLDKICEFADINIQKAMHTANTINNLQKKEFFEKTGTHMDTIHRITKASRRAEQRLRRFVKAQKKKKTRPAEKERGLRKNIAHFAIPSWPFLQEDMEFRFPAAKDFFEYVEQQKGIPEDYYTLSQYADAFCKYLLEAWAGFIKARDEFDKNVKKAKLKVHDVDLACMLCNELIKETHDKDQLRRAYVNLNTLEAVLDPDLYLAECWQESEMPCVEYNEEKLKDVVRGRIEEVGELLQKQDIDLHLFQELLNEWLKVAKKRNRVVAPFKADPESIEIMQFEDRLLKLSRELEEAGVEIVHKKDEHIFASVEGAEKFPEDCLAIRIDTHEKTYIAADPTKSGNRIYYPKQGYYGGIKVQDEPSKDLTLFEMYAYGGFLDKLFSGYLEEAVKHIKYCRNAFDSNRVPKDYLVFFIKKSQTYKAYVKGEEIKFRLRHEGKKFYDVKFKMHYTVEPNKKGELERIYITSIENLKLDKAKYAARFHDRINKLLKPLEDAIKEEEKFVTEVLHEQHPEDGFESWNREELKQAPTALVKKTVDQGNVLNDFALEIYKSYRAYRNGFRADFENEDRQCAKALWAMNAITQNTVQHFHASKEQMVVSSDSREGDFHIVTHTPGQGYDCTCEGMHFKKMSTKKYWGRQFGGYDEYMRTLSAEEYQKHVCKHIKKVMDS